MASVVSICNRALQIIGADDRIISITEDSRLARACNSCYDITRDTEQQKYFWRFCEKRVILAPDTDAPAFGFAKQYTIPSDCLRVMKQQEYGNDWVISGTKIMTDRDPTSIQLRYIARVEDPALFPPLFAEALAARIGMNIAEQITNSSTKFEMAASIYKETVSEARRADAFWSPQRKPIDDPWVAETR